MAATEGKAKGDDLESMRKNYQRASEVWTSPFDKSKDDMLFVAVPGNQWDQGLKQRRGNRPCYEFPKLRMQTQQVINEMRQTRPQGKVRGQGATDGALAELMQGICRNIESSSNAEQAYDTAFESAVQGGYGVWRICTDYANQDDFELDIRIKPIRNAFAAKCDPAAVEIDRRDANWWFVEELVAEETFKREHPNANLQDFIDDKSCSDWREKGQVRRAEYWYKKPVTRDLWAIRHPNGATEVVFPDEAKLTPEIAKQNGIKILRTRSIQSHKVYMRLTNGHEWLTEEYEFPSKFIPIIICWGNVQNIAGEEYFSGLVRFAKDAQRMHNVHRTAAIEAVAKAPKAPFITKPKWIEGFEDMWNKANAEDYPVLYINDDAEVGAMPKRAEQAQVPVALIQLAALDNDDMKAATGQYDASLGARSNETSGVAINSRKQQGATATFNFIDNLVYAIRYQYEILIDMIPRVMDTPRVVRILGEDGAAKWKELYKEVTDPETGEKVILNDISKGKYDVTVTVGQSFATQRMEAVDAFTQLASQIGGSLPALGPLLTYQVVKNLDVPGGDEFSTALRKILVGQGVLPPAEGDEPPAPPQPDPQQVALLGKLEAETRSKNADAAKKEAETATVAPTANAQIEKLIAEAVAQQLQNAIAGGKIALVAGGGVPFDPPPIYPQPTQEQQPPPGGFFSPESNGFQG